MFDDLPLRGLLNLHRDSTLARLVGTCFSLKHNAWDLSLKLRRKVSFNRPIMPTVWMGRPIFSNGKRVLLCTIVLLILNEPGKIASH